VETYFGETFTDELNIREIEEPKTEEVQTPEEPVKQIDYSELDKLIADMKS